MSRHRKFEAGHRHRGADETFTWKIQRRRNAMFADTQDSRRQHSLSKRLLAMLTLTFSLVCAAETLQAQRQFSSGSTGADGAFAPTASQSIVVPDSGLFNFTTVN